MKFIAKKVDDMVNTTSENPLVEAGKLLVGLVVLLVGIYALLGFVAWITLPLIPYSLEEKIGNLIYKAAFSEQSKENEKQIEVQALVEQLSANIPENHYDWKIHIVDSEVVNAGAMAGGHIVLFTGLLDFVESDRELAAVLAHEMGHGVNRDPIQLMSRSILLLAISMALTGQDSFFSNSLMKFITGVDLVYSRSDEKKADLFELDLLYKTYGDAKAAVSVMEKFENADFSKGLHPYFLSTHPNPGKRVAYMNEYIAQRGEN